MMKWDRFFYPHTVSIQNYRRGGGMGSGFDDPRDVAAEVRDEQRLVRNADGKEVVSSTQVTVPITETVPLQSKVTVWPGTARERTAQVLAVGTDDNGDDIDLDSFLVLSLT
ncbi:hypothetical protein [Marisediminicola sp. LYQ134]|uniref:hypothetical protein n=1 Tax=Marisediminicola sp. LYQ134 TaxID=3391061 RepID=UPI003982E485